MSTSTALDTWHRLVREHDPAGLDDLLADDVGIDGAGASAEEAAVHTIDET